jgi:hypothetical protein
MLTADEAGSVAEGLLSCCVGGIYSGASANVEERLAHRTATSPSVQLLGESTIMFVPKKFNLESRVETVRSYFNKTQRERRLNFSNNFVIVSHSKKQETLTEEAFPTPKYKTHQYSTYFL